MTTTSEAGTAAEARLAPADEHDAMAGPSTAERIDLVLGQHRQLQYETSRYIETVLGELKTIAHAASLKHLRYFLELTRQEAHDQTQRCRLDR